MLASFFLSLLYVPQMERCLPQAAVIEKSVQQSPFLSSTQVFTQWKESKPYCTFGWIPDLKMTPPHQKTKQKKNFKTENVLQLKGEEQNTKNYKEKDDLKAPYLLTVHLLWCKRQELVSCGLCELRLRGLVDWLVLDLPLITTTGAPNDFLNIFECE